MLSEKFKKISKDVQPKAEKLISDTLKGYVFGCVFGVFTQSKKPLLNTMHENGKNFAKMSAVYSVTEMTLEKIRKPNCPLNSFAAGALAGAIGSKQGMLPGSSIFGIYSGFSTYFSNCNDPNNNL
jgi:hypothetical protein